MEVKYVVIPIELFGKLVMYHCINSELHPKERVFIKEELERILERFTEYKRKEEG